MHFSAREVIFTAILRFLLQTCIHPQGVTSLFVRKILQKAQPLLQHGGLGFCFNLSFPLCSPAVYVQITGRCTCLGRVRDTCGCPVSCWQSPNSVSWSAPPSSFVFEFESSFFGPSFLLWSKFQSLAQCCFCCSLRRGWQEVERLGKLSGPLKPRRLLPLHQAG